MSKFYSAETQQGHSSHFFQYIKGIAEATSRQEEDQHVEADLKELKTSLTTLSSSSSSGGTDEDLLKEYAVRAYYAEMLGNSAEFAYIHCINLACSHRLLLKRTGYLATGLMVHPDSELMYLMVATIQRDLKSPNYLEVAAALAAAARMLRPELMTVVHGELAGLLLHEKPLVRRKAVEAMHAFYVRSDAAVGDVAAFRQALCDRDPSVMDAATRLLQEVILRDPASQRDLLDSFIFVLSQVIERRLPRAYEYHRMPAPWLQIRVTQVLTVLIGDDARLAEKAARVLSEAMQRADNGKLIGFAVVCEVVRTAASIPPQPGLLDLAAEAVSGLIAARNPNLRCAGIQALSYMVRVNPDLAVQHQEVVMRCLEDADETIRRKTIWLLFAICDRDNITPIARRLIQFLRRVGDPFLKRSTTRGLCRLMEQHASDPWWYIRTMNRVLAVAPECVLPATVQRMLKLIAEGQGASEAADTAFRVRCVEAYVAITGGGGSAGDGGSPGEDMTSSDEDEDGEEDDLARGPGSADAPVHVVPDVLRRIGAWVMGEYGFLASRVSTEMLLDRLCDLMEQTTDGETRCWVLTALSKVAAAQLQQPNGSVPDYVVDLVKQCQDSRCIPLQQRCYELTELLQSPPALLRRVVPRDGFCEEMQPDKALSFLDDFVAAAAARGARAYAQPAGIAALQRRLASTSASAADAASALRTAAYVPTRAMDVRPVWSAALATPAAPATPAEAAASGPRTTHADPAALPALNAGLAQSVLQETERLVLHPTATKRWGAPNMREAAAAAEEVHLQATAAAAVGGGGVVWGAETLLDTPAPEASAGATDAVAPAFREGLAAARSAGETREVDSPAGSRRAAAAAAAVAKPVSAKNAKFVRSIFGGGRRSGNGGAAEDEQGRGSRATAGTAAPVPPAAPARERGGSSGGVMNSLFAADTASAATAPTSSAATWFAEEPARTAPTAADAPRPMAAAGSTAWHPVDVSFTTARFEQAWKALGTAGECSRSLVLADLSDVAAPTSLLQRRLLHAASLRVVEVIGKELIAAATQRAGAQAEYVLAHLTVADPTTVKITVRAARREVSEDVMRRLQTS